MRLSLALSAAALLVSTAACSTDSPMSPTSPLAAKNSGGSCQQVYGNLVHTIQLASATDNYQIESGTFLEFMLGGQSLLPGQTAATVSDGSVVPVVGPTLTMTTPDGDVILSGTWMLGDTRRKTQHDVLGGTGRFVGATGRIQMGGWRSSQTGDVTVSYLYFSGSICTA